jgi:hypothetical protein
MTNGQQLPSLHRIPVHLNATFSPQLSAIYYYPRSIVSSNKCHLYVDPHVISLIPTFTVALARSDLDGQSAATPVSARFPGPLSSIRAIAAGSTIP